MTKNYERNPVSDKYIAPKNRLYRPKINFGRAFVFCVLCIVAAIALSGIIEYANCYFQIFSMKVSNKGQLFFSIYWKVQLFLVIISLKKIFIWLIRVYQRYASAERRLMCCFTPSCSEYAIIALNKYGVVIGIIKTVMRLLRCRPPGGIDYP